MELNRAALVSQGYHDDIVKENKSKDTKNTNINGQCKEDIADIEINIDNKINKNEQASQLDKNLHKEENKDFHKEKSKEKKEDIDNSKLKENIDILNKLLKKHHTKIEFERHEVFNDMIFKIVDEETGEIVTEVPPKNILDMVAKLCELAGVLVDKKA